MDSPIQVAVTSNPFVLTVVSAPVLNPPSRNTSMYDPDDTSASRVSLIPCPLVSHLAYWTVLQQWSLRSAVDERALVKLFGYATVISDPFGRVWESLNFRVPLQLLCERFIGEIELAHSLETPTVEVDCVTLTLGILAVHHLLI